MQCTEVIYLHILRKQRNLGHAAPLTRSGPSGTPLARCRKFSRRVIFGPFSSIIMSFCFEKRESTVPKSSPPILRQPFGMAADRNTRKFPDPLASMGLLRFLFTFNQQDGVFGVLAGFFVGVFPFSEFGARALHCLLRPIPRVVWLRNTREMESRASGNFEAHKTAWLDFPDLRSGVYYGQ